MIAQWGVLARYPDFRRLFAGNSISLLGSSVTTVAIPLTAVTHLDASPVQMGVLGAAAFLPHLVLGLPAGVWIDRLPYRRVLVLSDFCQLGLLGSVPILAALHLLALWQLYVIVLLAGICSLFDAIAAQTFTPSLLPRGELLAANGTLALSNSVITTSGAAIGGLLVQALTAPIAIAVDAVSFLVSGLSKLQIRAGRQQPRTEPVRQHLVRGILDGLRIVIDQPAMRALTISATIGALAGRMQAVVLVLYLVRELHLSSALVGLMIAVAGFAGILGAAVAVPITSRIGNGPAFITGSLLGSAAGLVLAAATGPAAAVLIIAGAAQSLRGWGPALYGVNQVTIRQTLIPADFLARAQATWRFLVFGMQPVGALLGGILGELLGLRSTLVVSSILMLAGTGAAFASPLRTLTLERQN